MADMIHVDDDNFEKEVLKSGIPVLVDFWAEWCAPCRMIAPMVDEISSEYSGKAKIVKFDIDKGPKVPSQYAVTSIPTLVLFKNGQPVDKLIGAVPKSKIKGIIDSAL
jgi:thioredoxin 1